MTKSRAKFLDTANGFTSEAAGDFLRDKDAAPVIHFYCHGQMDPGHPDRPGSFSKAILRLERDLKNKGPE